MGTAMDILGSDWSNSSNWSGSQDDKQEDIYPFLARNQDTAGPNMASVSEQTNVMITGGRAVTGCSSYRQGSSLSRPLNESTCCSPVSAGIPPAAQLISPPAQNLLHDTTHGQDDAASDFSRSSSSNWSHDDRPLPHSTAEGSARIQLAELIGRGAFGSVYRGCWKGRPAAIKVTHDRLRQPATKFLLHRLCSTVCRGCEN